MLRAVLCGASLLIALAAQPEPAPVQAAPNAEACASIREAARVASDAPRFRQATALLPTPMAARLADELGRSDAAGAASTLALAIALACPAPARFDAAALASLRGQDDRFVGLRVDETFSDKLLKKLWGFFERLLESEAMQRFSEHTRTVYLSLLLAVLGVVGLRVWRNQRPGAAHAPGEERARIARARRDAYARCHSDAVAIVDTDPRGALLLARRALLTRVGEVDHGAVRPSRTSTELIAAVTPRLAAYVRHPLAAFDEAFYGRDANADDARAVIAAVDAAHRAIGQDGGAP